MVETYGLEIHCTLTKGSPDPTLSWQHNGVPISTEDYQVVSEDSAEILLIETVTPTRDNGTFTCIAEIDGVGSANRTSTVTVIGTFMQPVSVFLRQTPALDLWTCITYLLLM